MVSVCCSVRRSEGFGSAYNVEDDGRTDEVEAVGVNQAGWEKVEAIKESI